MVAPEATLIRTSGQNSAQEIIDTIRKHTKKYGPLKEIVVDTHGGPKLKHEQPAPATQEESAPKNSSSLPVVKFADDLTAKTRVASASANQRFDI